MPDSSDVTLAGPSSTTLALAPWRVRAARAWRALTAADATAHESAPINAVTAPSADAVRTVIATTYPNQPGVEGLAGLSLVRTANPQEYKPEGATIRVQGFSEHPVVHACIRAIVDIAASVPLVVLQSRGDRDSRVPESHPLQRLLDTPNPRLTSRNLRARLCTDFIGYGNALLHLERPSPGRLPIALRPINAESLMSVWIDPEGDPRRYDYGNWAGMVIRVPSEDVLHARDLFMPRPFQPEVFGYPRGAAAIRSMLADNEATNYVRQVVTNDGTPTFAVMLADEATQDDASAMQDRYRARIVDRGKRGTPAFFGAVKDIKPLGFTLSDLEFPDLRRVSREDICAAYGVDPRMIGVGSATKDGGLSGVQYAEARARLVQHTIEPLMAALEDELNHWLAPEFGDVWISFDHDVLRDLVENDTETSTRVRAEFAASLRTWEESRSALRLSPLPEPTDTISQSAGTKLVPAAVAVIDPRAVLEATAAIDTVAANDPAAGPQGSAAPPEPPETIDEPPPISGDRHATRATTRVAAPGFGTTVAVPADDNANDDADNDGPDGEPDGDPDDGQQAALENDPKYRYWRRAMDELDAREGRFFHTGLTRFAADKQAVARMFSAAAKRTRADMRDYTRDDTRDDKPVEAPALPDDAVLRKVRQQIAQAYGPEGDFYRAWEEAYRALIGETYLAGAKQVAGVGFSFQLQSPYVTDAIARRASTLAGYIGEETSKQVLAAIHAGETAGMSVREISRLVQASVYGEQMTDVRATRIARTESAGAMSQGGWDQAQEMGIYRSKEWLAFEDNKTRETHSACMAQGRIGIDEPFSNGLMYPLDPAGDAGEVINCRCTLLYDDNPPGA